MICTICGYSGEPKEFSTTNKSADGTKAICKECRRKAAIEGRRRKKEKDHKLPYFELIPSLIRIRNKARIGVLIMNNFVDRESRKKKGFHNINIGNIGLSAILGELKEPYEHCPPEAINQFEFVLVSLTSVMDVENLIYNMEVYGPAERECKIVIGGFGVININLIIPYIDIAVFGRAEGQINDILAGRQYPNVWRKACDPEVENRYVIRQPRYLVKGERSIGCRNNCCYCQYTHTRRSINGPTKYDPGMSIQETDWIGLAVTKAGRYNSAWDGWSDETRRRVNKPVTDKTIEHKLIKIDESGIIGTINIKVFMIVGYPWETMESVQHDIEQVTHMLRRIDGQMRGRINLSFLCTPFSPPPLTPMQCDKADIETNWRDINGRVLLDGNHIRAYISPFISSAYQLVKRVMIDRAEIGDLDLFKRVAFSGKLLKFPQYLRVKWLLKYNAIDQSVFSKINRDPVPYLRIEDASPKVCRKLWE